MTGNVSDRRIFIYVQHLLGVGHLKRAAALARALAKEQFHVTLASGGPPVPGLSLAGIRFVQLPAVLAADTGFKVLIDDQAAPIDRGWRERRTKALLDAWRTARPHALIVELFPFGRRQMRFELVPLLEEARARRPKPVIACSVRDVLQHGSAARVEQTLFWLERYFDRVLVHGDPAFLAFDATFPKAQRIAGKLHYTGYLAEIASTETPGSAGAGEVLVSAGGGAVGRHLLDTAIRSRPLSVLRERTWRVLTGINLAEDDFEALRTLAAQSGEGRVLVERHRDDFQALLANCCVSVSQGGYNTVIEALYAGARALVVPFAGGAESEQSLRAELLAQRGLVDVLHEHSLAPATLARAIDRAAGRPAPAGRALDLQGGKRSADLLRHWMAESAQ